MVERACSDVRPSDEGLPVLGPGRPRSAPPPRRKPDQDCCKAGKNDPPIRLPLENVSSTNRRSTETLPPIQRHWLPANPTRGSDPPTTCARTVSTLPYSIPLRAPCDTRITTPINQTRRPSLIQAFCQPRPWEVQLADSQGGSDRQSKRFLRQNLYPFG